MSSVTMPRFPLGIHYTEAHAAGEFAIVDVDTFGLFFLNARESSDQIAYATSVLDDERDDVAETVFRVSLDGQSGYAVRPDGELVYVFSLVKGRGDRIVNSAKRDGAVYLDCFDGYLVAFYGRHGFDVNARIPNWIPGDADVVYMSQPGFKSRHGL